MPVKVMAPRMGDALKARADSRYVKAIPSQITRETASAARN